MFCEKCGKEMQGKFCTNCGWKKEESNNQPPKAKKPLHKKWWFWLIVVLVVIALVPSGKKDDNVEIKSSGNNDNKQAQEVVIPKVGDTFATKDFEITVTNVEERNRVGNKYLSSTPAEGGKYVCVQFKYKNISNEPISSWNFPDIYLIDSNNSKYSPDISASSYYATEVDPNRKVFSDLNPQITTTECAVFEVSKETYSAETWKIFIHADKDTYVEI